jgi:fructuronate reductase
VVVDPQIINPKEFIDQVINERLNNPFMPDSPQRIAMDTSLKMPIRFGETIKAYKSRGKSLAELKYIPLVFAGWLRYLLSIDDEGRAFEVSLDPQYEAITAYLSGISLGQTGSFHAKLEPVLSNPALFGVNLYEAGLGGRVEELFAQMLTHPGAVRKVLSQNTR